MPFVLDQNEFVEYREHPSGFERCGVKAKPLGILLASAVTVSYRTNKKGPWHAATAGSVYQVSRATWESWTIVTDPLAV